MKFSRFLTVVAALLVFGVASAHAARIPVGCENHIPVSLVEARACGHPTQVRDVSRPVVRVADPGFDWTSAAIGAGVGAGLLLAAGSSAALLRRGRTGPVRA